MLLANEKNTKDAIILILGTQWPLSARRIYSACMREHGLNMTYQAVHKTLSGMEKKGMIKRTCDGYMISKEWIDDLYSFSKKMKHKYSGESFISTDEFLRIGSPISSKFSTLFELDRFFVELTGELSGISKRKEIIMHYRHNWWPLFYSKNESDLASRNAGRCYFLCASGTAVDKWCCEFERNMGFNIKYPVRCAELCDIQVYGNIVFQIFIPPETMSVIDNIYSRTGDMNKFDKSELIKKAFERKCTITVIADRNPGMAQNIRNFTLSHFR